MLEGPPHDKAANFAPPASMAINPIPMDDSIRSQQLMLESRPVIAYGLEQPQPVKINHFDEEAIDLENVPIKGFLPHSRERYLTRCFGGRQGKPDYRHYPTTKWGTPTRGTTNAFVRKDLPGGLSIGPLPAFTNPRKRRNFREAFDGFRLHQDARLHEYGPARGPVCSAMRASSATGTAARIKATIPQRSAAPWERGGGLRQPWPP